MATKAKSISEVKLTGRQYLEQALLKHEKIAGQRGYYLLSPKHGAVVPVVLTDPKVERGTCQEAISVCVEGSPVDGLGTFKVNPCLFFRDLNECQRYFAQQNLDKEATETRKKISPDYRCNQARWVALTAQMLHKGNQAILLPLRRKVDEYLTDEGIERPEGAEPDAEYKITRDRLRTAYQGDAQGDLVKFIVEALHPGTTIFNVEYGEEEYEE